MKAPTSLSDLVDFLAQNPEVTFTNLDGSIEDSTFLRAEAGGLWFRRHGVTGFVPGSPPEHFLPVNCRMGAAGQHESGVTFDAAGFVLEKFGRQIRVDYRVEE